MVLLKFISGSIYLTISLAVERYITVCHPFFKLTHNWPARKRNCSQMTFKCFLRFFCSLYFSLRLGEKSLKLALIWTNGPGRATTILYVLYTDKKENKILLTYKEIQMRSNVKYEEGLPKKWGTAQIFSPYEDVVSRTQMWLCTRPLWIF